MMQDVANSSERLLPIKDAAAWAGVGPKTLRRAIRDGRLRRAGAKVRKVLIAYADLVLWMDGKAPRMA
ncbi:MAG: helix-turn-helix domain-containing protein [Tepidisphaeraceae bacterium]|jgi:predicted site-specific integrase-resolvase